MSLDHAPRPAARHPGFVPRQNDEAEEAVLGAVLLSADALVAAADVVTPLDFYRPRHQAVFRAALNLFERGVPVDPLTVFEEMTRIAPNTATFSELNQLSANTPSSQSAAHYAAIVRECAQIRRLDSAAAQVRSLAQEALSATAAIDQAEHLIFDVSNDARRAPVATSSDLAATMLHEALEAVDSPGALRGLSSGFADIDRYLRGLRAGQFLVVGARPAVGKTAFGLHVALENARAGVGVLFCSLEMSRTEIALRLGSMMSGLDYELVADGRLTTAQWDQWNRAASELSQLPLWVDDDASLDVFRIKARARRHQREGLGLVVIDYLQLVATPDAETRQVAVSALSRGLKLTAKQLNLPVLALSQLSRALETRADKTPQLSDLRESGSLEQDADVVLLLSRDLEPTSLRRGVLEVRIAKNRSGRVGKVDLAWRPHVTGLASLTPPAI